MLVDLYSTEFSAGKVVRQKVNTVSVLTFNRRSMVRYGKGSETVQVDATMAATFEIPAAQVVLANGKFYSVLNSTTGTAGYFIHFLKEVNENE